MSAVCGFRSRSSWARVLEHKLSTCGPRAQSLHDMWDLPRSGIQPMSPALAERFSTTEPLEKPHLPNFKDIVLLPVRFLYSVCDTVSWLLLSVLPPPLLFPSYLPYSSRSYLLVFFVSYVHIMFCHLSSLLNNEKRDYLLLSLCHVAGERGSLNVVC